MKKITILIFTLLLVFSCSIEEENKNDLINIPENGIDGTSIDIIQLAEGCKEYITFIDLNRDGYFQQGEPFFRKIQECPNNIKTIQVIKGDCIDIVTFHDNININGVVDEGEQVDYQNTLCPPDTPENGRSIVVTLREATKEECFNEGTVTIIHYDDGEFVGEYVTCNGMDGNNAQDGENGTNSMIVSEIIGEGEYGCEHGGLKIIIMNDKNADGDFEDAGEVNVEIICNLKCVHQEEVCTDVYDTVNCRNNNEVYVMWIDGVYYYNIDLQFEQLSDGTASLYGKVNKHNSTKVFLVDVIFSNVVQESVKNHNCLTVDSSEWIQYGSMDGTVKSVDGSVEFTVSRRGEPTQYGVGANVTSSKNKLGVSGWFYTDGHSKCKGDFNFNLECQ